MKFTGSSSQIQDLKIIQSSKINMHFKQVISGAAADTQGSYPSTASPPERGFGTRTTG